MDIIQKIKKKKELSDIPDTLVKEVLDNYLSTHKISLPSNSKQLNTLIKEIRAILRKYTGRFQVSSKKRNKLLEENKIQELLKTHTSTRERIEIYPWLKKLIYSYKPSSILDLGCGLNPIAIASNQSAIKYYAYDIKKSELEIIKSYFQKNIKSSQNQVKTYVKDITKVKEFPKTDMCLIFKVLDILENKTQAELLFKKIKSPIIIVSFSTKTLSGKPMNSPRRIWFEKFLEKLSLKFKTLKFQNEIFYIIKTT